MLSHEGLRHTIGTLEGGYWGGSRCWLHLLIVN